MKKGERDSISMDMTTLRASAWCTFSTLFTVEAAERLRRKGLDIGWRRLYRVNAAFATSCEPSIRGYRLAIYKHNERVRRRRHSLRKRGLPVVFGDSGRPTCR